MIQQYFNTCKTFVIFQLRKSIQASEQKVTELRHEIDSGKTVEMSLEKSKSICEAQMRALDKKYNGESINIFNFQQLKIENQNYLGPNLLK